MNTLEVRNRLKVIGAAAICWTIMQPMEVQAGQYDNLVPLQSLKGLWSFSIGINDEWVSPKYDDSGWETIRVPSPWEDQGFNGYNGYACYRKKVTIPSAFKGRMLYLNLGYIDDVDEVYVNGYKIGSSGSFPPDYVTAYNARRVYYLPEQYVRFDGTNLIAVKVYDSYQAGGIVSGEIGIYGGKVPVHFDINLQSSWKFKPGDDLRRKDPEFDDRMWDAVFVPARWEDQGFRDYDGYGWYRKTIVYPATLSGEKMVILLGKIDDIDQVYINGILVGSTGNFPEKPGMKVRTGEEWRAFRGYYIPAGILKRGQKNVIAVRVMDNGGEGGIYEGPVGILSQSRYIEYWKEIKRAGH